MEPIGFHRNMQTEGCYQTAISDFGFSLEKENWENNHENYYFPFVWLKNGIYVKGRPTMNKFTNFEVDMLKNGRVLPF